MDVQGQNTPAKSVSQLQTAHDLQKKLESLERGRAFNERQWKLNMAFYKGKQYSYFPRNAWQLTTLPTEDGDKPRWRVRLVSNQIMVGAHSLLAKYTKTKPQMFATPGSSSESDVKAAQLSERLLEYWWEEMKLDDKLEEALLWGIIAGQGFWKISWDPQAGKAMKFLLDPSGQPITDDALKDAFRGKLEQYGIPPQEQTVYVGDIKVDVMSPFHVYLDNSAKTFSECKYAICKHYLDPDEIYSRWGVWLNPDSVTADPDKTLPLGNAEDAAERTVKQINVGYFLPTAALPEGRYVVWAASEDGKDAQPLEDGPWPYPITELPLVKFPGLRVPGSVYDSSVIEHAIPLQKELNRTLSQLVEFKNLTLKPRVWAPVNSLRQRLTNEPGAVYEYNPINGMKPEIEQLPSMPSYVFEHLKDIGTRIKEIFGQTEVLEGRVPPNVEAGIAIDLLQEMAIDRMAPTIKLIENAIEDAGQFMLCLAQQYYIEPRLLKIKGSGGSYMVQRFNQADLDSGVSVSVQAGSGIPRTRAGQQARIMQYMQMGVIAPEDAYKYVDVADLKSIGAKWQTDEDLAFREHEKILKGIPLNPEAIQEAMMWVNQGMNPETGQPLRDQQEAQVVLQRAALQPGIADIHPIHLDVHGRFIKSVEFENLPPEIRQAFIWHFQLTQEAAHSLPQPEPEAPRINLQLKSTVGPTAQSKILQQAGVPVSPEESSEPPLETWVNDSVDKPDVDNAGPGQEAESLSKVAAQTLQSQIALNNAQAQQAMNQQNQQMKAEAHQQKLRHAEAMHSHASRKAEEDIALAQKKTRQSNFKPKPKAAKK